MCCENDLLLWRWIDSVALGCEMFMCVLVLLSQSDTSVRCPRLPLLIIIGIKPMKLLEMINIFTLSLKMSVSFLQSSHFYFQARPTSIQKHLYVHL